MATVISWGLANGEIGYIMDPGHPDQALKSKVELDSTEVEKIREWVEGIDVSTEKGKEIYTQYFNNLQSQCQDTYLGNAEDYIDIPGDIKSLIGPQGPKGDRGEAGPIGPAGSKGDVGIANNTLFVYRLENDAETVPARPSGGSWDGLTNKIVYPDGWSGTDELGKGFVWMSNKTFYYPSLPDNVKKSEWSNPVRITGENGKPGEDGDSMEFVYCLLANDMNGLKPVTPEKEVSGKDWIFESTDGDRTYYWYDHPQGINIDYKIEWVSTRIKKKGADGKPVWGKFSEPVIWSRWGDRGQDGDGIEYIYCLRTDGRPIEKENDPSLLPAVQEDEYNPLPEIWTDDPSGVSEESPFEWISSRKKRSGKWSEFKKPVIWSHYGEKGDIGDTGYGIKTKYARTEGTDTAPDVAFENIEPGSDWLDYIPKQVENGVRYTIWAIQTLFNYTTGDFAGDLKKWSLPYIITGTNGKDAPLPNFNMNFFSLPKDKKIPNEPTVYTLNEDGINKLKESGWFDAPNGPGHWYQCNASVEGFTKAITWGPILDTMGKPGPDGTYQEIRFTTVNEGVIPVIAPDQRDPNLAEDPGYKWVLGSELGEFDINTSVRWETIATIRRYKGKGSEKDSEYSTFEEIIGNWCAPFRVSGENGKQGNPGATGEQGPSGIPGVGFSMRYHLGDENGPKDVSGDGKLVDAKIPENIFDYSPSSFPGWFKTQAELSEEAEATKGSGRLYTWIIQARTVSTMGSDGSVTEDFIPGERWSKPIILNGVKGEKGDKAPIIYPEGIYDPKKPYCIFDNKAPYVWDSAAGKYYVYNKRFDGDPNNIWVGGNKGDEPGKVYEVTVGENTYTVPGQKGMTPGDAHKTPGMESVWEEFENFEALYTKIGVVANGLVGEAVFNNEFMFSQSGKTNSGELTSAFEGFLDGYFYNTADSKYYIDKGYNTEVKDLDPYDAIHSFHPNYCTNFRTGEVWMATGAMYVDKSGNTVWGRYDYSPNPVEPSDTIKALEKSFSSQTGADITNGVALATTIGVRSNKGKTKAIMNGSDSIKNSKTGSTLMLAAGIPESGGSFDERANQASSRIYEDGTLYAKKGEIGSWKLGNGSLGTGFDSQDEFSKANGMRITNSNLLFNKGLDYITDDYTSTVCVGSNAYPATAGFPGLGLFDLKSNSSLVNALDGYGIECNVSGFNKNVAFSSKSGIFEGIRYSIQMANSENRNIVADYRSSIIYLQNNDRNGVSVTIMDGPNDPSPCTVGQMLFIFVPLVSGKGNSCSIISNSSTIKKINRNENDISEGKAVYHSKFVGLDVMFFTGYKWIMFSFDNI